MGFLRSRKRQLAARDGRRFVVGSPTRSGAAAAGGIRPGPALRERRTTPGTTAGGNPACGDASGRDAAGADAAGANAAGADPARVHTAGGDTAGRHSGGEAAPS